MRRATLVLVGLGLLGSCATAPPPAPPPPIAPAPPPIYTPPPAPPPPPPPDQCGAVALQSLVGRPRTEIPVPVNPGLRRVACTTCPMTMDYQPFRLNILYDEETGVVREVKCG